MLSSRYHCIHVGFHCPVLGLPLSPAAVWSFPIGISTFLFRIDLSPSYSGISYSGKCTFRVSGRHTFHPRAFQTFFSVLRFRSLLHFLASFVLVIVNALRESS